MIIFKRKNDIFQAWVIVIKSRVMLFPASDTKFDKVVAVKPSVNNVILLLQVVRNG